MSFLKSKSLVNKINTVFPIPRLKFPTELNFEPIQLCNALCTTCPYPMLEKDSEYKGKKMSADQIFFLLSDFGNLLKKNNYSGNAVVIPYRYSDPLICKDLNIIFELGKKFNFKVRLTTNGVSFKVNNSILINNFIDQIDDEINISVLGSTQEKVKKNMSVNLEVTMKRLANVKINYPVLASKIKIKLARMENTDEEENEFNKLSKDFKDIGFETFEKRDWIHNRIIGSQYPQSENNFIAGCGLYNNKILRRIDVMMNGSVVLCNDVWESARNFGNVFQDGIEKIWNTKLLDEHKLIYNKKFSDSKKELICITCSRAQFNNRKNGIYESIYMLGKIDFLKNFLRKNINWI